MLPTQDLLRDTQEFQQLLNKAAQVAYRLQSRVPEIEEPAVRAQASVLCAFLFQVDRQQQLLTDMIQSSKNQRPNGQHV